VCCFESLAVASRPLQRQLAETFFLTESNEDNKGFQLFGDQDSVSFVIAYLESSSLSPAILLPALSLVQAKSLFLKFCMFSA
jgi:hypothetical protein